MRKTTETYTPNAITVTISELQARLNCGRDSAEKIAGAAGARIKVGRRTLYHVGKVEAYLKQLADEQSSS